MKDKLELAYLAGIIDGEGHIRLNRINNRKRGWRDTFHAVIGVGMTEPHALEILYQRYGGSFRLEDRSSIANHKSIYRWSTAGNKKVPPIIRELLPYLKVKKLQAEEVLKFIDELQNFSGRNLSGKFATPDDVYTKRLMYFERIKEMKNEQNHSELLTSKTKNT